MVECLASLHRLLECCCCDGCLPVALRDVRMSRGNWGPPKVSRTALRAGSARPAQTAAAAKSLMAAIEAISMAIGLTSKGNIDGLWLDIEVISMAVGLMMAIGLTSKSNTTTGRQGGRPSPDDLGITRREERLKTGGESTSAVPSKRGHGVPVPDGAHV